VTQRLMRRTKRPSAAQPCHSGEFRDPSIRIVPQFEVSGLPSDLGADQQQAHAQRRTTAESGAFPMPLSIRCCRYRARPIDANRSGS